MTIEVFLKPNIMKLTNRIGEVKFGIKIIAYRHARDMDVEFPDGTIKKNVRYSHFKNNNIKNLNFPIVFGVGFLGVGKYNQKDNRKMYQTWASMFQRCYSEEKKKTHPTYIGCTVCVEWHNYQNFAKWFEENFIEGFCLDKDLTVFGNKIYSPDTCKFIPNDINMILTNIKSGVFPRKGQFESKINVNSTQKYLGVFNSKREAFLAYKIAKESHIKQQAEKHRCSIGETIYNNLINYTINS